MDFSLIIPAFIAGILTFLAPCTLPLVPAYLGFISGVSLEDLKDQIKSRRTRWKIFKNGLSFVLGWSMVFILLGTLAGLAGSALVPYRLWLTRIGGIFVIIFGLFMLNVLKLPMFRSEKHFKVPAIFERGKPLNSLILGSSFGLGWTPCVGPILGTVLLLASSTATVFKGTLLLSVFSVGLAVPFLAIAIGIGSAAEYINKTARYLGLLSVVGGFFLIALGVLLFTDKMVLLIPYAYRLFGFINYGRLLDYL